MLVVAMRICFVICLFVANGPDEPAHAQNDENENVNGNDEGITVKALQCLISIFKLFLHCCAVRTEYDANGGGS